MKKIKRLLFCCLYYCFAQYLPPSYIPLGFIWRKVRYLICRNLFLSCGKNVNVESRAFFHSGRNISIGHNSGIGLNAKLFGKVKIGNNVMMGPDVIIITRNHEFTRTDIPIIQQGGQDEGPVKIANDVWIGARVIILPNVYIGNGVIIGAGSIVTKSVPDYAVIAGNPAKVTRKRK